MNCNVIRDLLPLYIDECCSSESECLIKEHLQECEACKRIYENMQKPIVETHKFTAKNKFERVHDWKASLLQTFMLFASFAVLALGVIAEGGTPAGMQNGLWAVALIVPSAGYLLSISNWFFIRYYKSKRAFSNGSCLITFILILLGYLWAALHYAFQINLTSPLVFVGALLSATLCILSKTLTNKYADLLGRE